ncbi:MAG: hypothetical protein LBJ14_06490 [Desulfarculales bacterium]|jgi:hypothetical protein|nr:hypothetical protein [Desulfarculales bacterium]
MLSNLHRLTEASRNLLEQVRLCASIQHLDCDHADYELQEMALEGLWKKRAHLFRELERRLAVIGWENWFQELDRLSSDEQEEALTLLDEAKTALDEIRKQDGLIRVVLEELYRQAVYNMQSMEQRQRLVKAYLPVSLTSPRHALPAQLSKTG